MEEVGQHDIWIDGQTYGQVNGGRDKEKEGRSNRQSVGPKDILMD